MTDKIKVTHVIFDLDGVILETESIFAKIGEEIAEEYGKQYTEDMKVKVMGTPEPESIRIMMEELKLPITREEFVEKYITKVNLYTQSPELMPGVEELIRHLHCSGVPLAVATSSNQDQFRTKTQNYKDLMSLFEHVVCSGTDPEVQKGKPHPDVFQVAAKRFPGKPCPCKVLVFEDSPNGVAAAKTAGMRVVMIPNPTLPEDNPWRKRADQVIPTFYDLKLEMFDLPPLPEKRK
ncbi:unnamed protein product [Phyllotreta striolata]|uniref:pseudouridine 5'-phosphatase n=1 Tax=Phyllotreta striolata TaxID=444603 RepID=A0A9P0GTN8_PHYSR|nr:unnamed protein product [Phyllotreta striolata]